MPHPPEAIVRGLYAAALGLVPWAEPLEHVAELVRADHLILNAGLPPFLAAARIDQGDVLRLVTATAGLAYDGPSLDSVSDGRAALRSQLMRDADYARTAHFNEVIRPLGGFHCVFAKAAVAASALVVCRGGRRGDFDLSEARLVEALLPHLGMAMEVHVRLARAEAGTATLEALLEGVVEGTIVCDRTRRPLFANTAARRLLAQDDGLGAGVSALLGATPEDTRRLRTAIDEAGRTGAARLRLSRPSGRPALLVRVVSASRFGVGSLGPGCAVLFVAEPDAVRPVDRDAVAEIFGLTRREAEVAVRLASGAGPAAIAASLGLGLSGVRSYLKRIFHKTGTHSQAALVALLRSFV